MFGDGKFFSFIDGITSCKSIFSEEEIGSAREELEEATQEAFERFDRQRREAHHRSRYIILD